MNWKSWQRPRFSLAILLFATAVVAAAMKGIVLPEIEAARQRSIEHRLFLGGIGVDREHAYSGSSACYDWSASDAALVELPKLKHVTSVIIHGDEHRPQRLTSNGLGNLGRMPQIKLLYLRETPNDGKGMAFLASLINLEELLLEDVDLTANDLIYLQKCKSLRHLYFYETSIGSEVILEIAKIEHLQSLIFVDCQLQHSGLAPLRNLRKLKSVSVRGRNLPKTFFEQWRFEQRGINIEIAED